MRLSLDHDTLRIELNWWQRLLAAHLSTTLVIPLSHIERADTERVATHWGEIRFPGSFIPWALKAGTFRRAGRRDFWYVTGGQPVLRLTLKDEYFTSITLGMRDNEEWVAEIGGRLAPQA